MSPEDRLSIVHADAERLARSQYPPQSPLTIAATGDWINELHRRSVVDAGRIAFLMAEVIRSKRRWWKVWS